MEERFIVESGAGFVFDAKRMEMISDPVLAARLEKNDAELVAENLEAAGLSARIVPVRVAKIAPQNAGNKPPQVGLD